MNWDWLKEPQLQRLLAALGEARVAGGAVRNALLGEPVEEVDVACAHAPEKVGELAVAAGFSVHPTGLEHGTVTVAREGRAFEVTTLRHDVETDGRRAKVAFTGDWEADARRRDFTINAIYCAADGEIFDYVGGRQDIAARRVRFVGEPEARITEDYLRILRFFRFHARYGTGAPDAAGLAACARHKAGLQRLSPERVRQELLKLLVARGAVAALADMEAAGIHLLPEADFDSFARMAGLDAMEQLSPDAMLRLAALAPRMDMKEALRLSNAQARRLEEIAAAPALSPGLRERERRQILYALKPALWRDVVRVSWARAGSGEGWRELHDLPERWEVPAFPVKGADLAALGLKPGPEMGAALAALEDWWLAHDFAPDRVALLQHFQKGELNG